jgi:protein-disulfide isomerase
MTTINCPLCQDRFTNDAALRDHCWDAHGACHRCSAEFDEQYTLYTHWLAVHEDELSRTERAQAESAVGELTFRDRLTHAGPTGALRNVTVTRRKLLGGGVVGLGALVGGFALSGGFGGDSTGPALAAHPAATGLENQPTLGPSPAEADGTIIAFEDPSCSSCARFERGTFPQLKSDLIDTDSVAFVFRGIPVVFDWGKPAILALEATYARTPDAFWALKAFYYRSQGKIGSQNVRDVTRQFLADQTDVDATAVLEDVDSGTHGDAVEADLQASQDAGVRGTPTFFLFRDGSFVTELVGPQSYTVFKNALGV